MNRNKRISKSVFFIVFIVLASGCAYKASVDQDELVFGAGRMDLNAYRNVQDRDEKLRRDLVVTVAFSGGGHRAGNLATGVLLGLEKIKHPKLEYNLLLEIDYFSTVSGGGFAAGNYLSVLHDFFKYGKGELSSFKFYEKLYEVPTPCKENESFEGESPLRNIERGYSHTLLFNWGIFKSIFTSADRGDYLEKRLDKKMLGADCRSVGDKYFSTLTLSDVFVRKTEQRSPKLPYWIANATIFQNGELFQFAPDVLERFGIDMYWHRASKIYQKDHGDTRCGTRDDGQSNGFADCLPLSVGMKASASFPVGIPATTLRSSHCENCFLQLMDGGTFDNLGIFSAMLIIKQHRELYEKNSGNNARHLLFIVDAFPGEIQPFSESSGGPSVFRVAARQLGVTKDALRNYMKTESERINSDFYPRDTTVIFLDIDNHIDAKKIKTEVNISEKKQKLLIRAGKELVEEAKPKIEAFLKELPE